MAENQMKITENEKLNIINDWLDEMIEKGFLIEAKIMPRGKVKELIKKLKK